MKNYTITVNGTAYNVSVEEGTSAAPAAAPVAAAPGTCCRSRTCSSACSCCRSGSCR